MKGPAQAALRQAISTRLAGHGQLADLGLGAVVQARCAEIFSEPMLHFHALCELYAARTAFDLAGDLGWHPRLRAGASLEDCLEGLHPQSRPPAIWILDFLAQEGWLDRKGDRFQSREEPPFGTAEIRATGEEAAPGQGISFDLLDAVRSRILPFFLEGKPSEQLLFDLTTLPLWLSYFSNANLEYLPNNFFAMLALLDGLPPGARVLELGGGAGSFAELLSMEGSTREFSFQDYRFTDIAPTFLRRAQRELAGRAPGIPFSFQSLDLNRAFDAQGLVPGSFDAVVGVNVLHVAHDLVDVLPRVRALLAPGGRLVLGECLKPDLDTPIYLEFFFKFVKSFTEVKLDPELRPAGGFLTPEAWEKLLRHAGFNEVQRYPDTRAVLATHRSFFVGALRARA